MRKVMFFLFLLLMVCSCKPEKTIVVELTPKVDAQKIGKIRESTNRERRDDRCRVTENCLFGYELDAHRMLYRDDPPDWKDTKIFTEKKLKALRNLPLSRWFIGNIPIGEAFCTRERDGVICLPMRLLGNVKRGSICYISFMGEKFSDYRLYYGSYHCPYLTLDQAGGVEFLVHKLYFVHVKSLNHCFVEYVKSGDAKNSDFDYLENNKK